MKKENFSYEALYRVVEFLAKKEEVTMEMYVSSLQKKIESEALVESLLEDFEKLSTQDKAILLNLLEKKSQGKARNEVKQNSDATPKEYSLEELIKKDVGDLVKTKPQGMKIDDLSFEVRSWTEVSCQFVRFLIERKELRAEDLPLCPSNRSPKAFINSDKGQPDGVNADSNFIKVADGFYVDSKYNAKYHLLNIWRTLKKLNIESKYDVYVLI